MGVRECVLRRARLLGPCVAGRECRCLLARCSDCAPPHRRTAPPAPHPFLSQGEEDERRAKRHQEDRILAERRREAAKVAVVEENIRWVDGPWEPRCPAALGAWGMCGGVRVGGAAVPSVHFCGATLMLGSLGCVGGMSGVCACSCLFTWWCCCCWRWRLWAVAAIGVCRKCEAVRKQQLVMKAALEEEEREQDRRMVAAAALRDAEAVAQLRVRAFC
jgi:hypothetical protein